MKELWVAIATGALALAGTLGSVLLNARSERRSLPALQALVVDERLPGVIRAEAAAALVRALVRRGAARASWTVGSLYVGFGGACLVVRLSGDPSVKGQTARTLLVVALELLVCGTLLVQRSYSVGSRDGRAILKEKMKAARREVDPKATEVELSDASQGAADAKSLDEVARVDKS